MAFADGLTETCTIYTDLTAKDLTTYQDVELNTVKYSNIKCRLHMAGQSRQIVPGETAAHPIKRQLVLMVEPQYDEALPGYRVEHNGQDYVISERKKVFGQSSEPHHVVYILDKKHPQNESA